MDKKTLILTIIGALSGIPLSYYLQSDSVQNQFEGIDDYLTGLWSVLDKPGPLGRVRMVVIGSAIAGSILGGTLDFLWHLIKKN